MRDLRIADKPNMMIALGERKGESPAPISSDRAGAQAPIDVRLRLGRCGNAGPIPGEYSLLSIGACDVDDESRTFACEIKPINRNADPNALEIRGQRRTAGKAPFWGRALDVGRDDPASLRKPPPSLWLRILRRVPTLGRRANPVCRRARNRRTIPPRRIRPRSAWLAFAGAGLAAGLKWRKDWLCRASLAGVGLVVAKVFVSDMAALGGVLRALSFLGLGGALVGIGYAYRRLHPLQQE
jgi:hypothetical protein